MSWSLSYNGTRDELDSALDQQLSKLASSQDEAEMRQIKATVEFVKAWAQAAAPEQTKVEVSLGGHADSSFTSFSGSLNTSKGF
jgi:lysyl-tRNA synthetase class I